MKKLLLLSLSLWLTAQHLTAQNTTTWLAPGARWGFSYLSNGGNQGDFFLSNDGDTVINNQVFKRLLEKWQPTVATSFVDNKEYYLIARNDSVLWRYHPDSTLFTVYDFTRQIGDTLPVLPYFASFLQQRLIVIDTGTALWGNNIPIKYQDVEIQWLGGASSYSDTTRLYERIGHERDFLLWSIAASPLHEISSHLFCYRDNEYPLSDCLSATTEPAPLAMRVFPNPARQSFQVDLTAETSASRLRLYDLQGQLVAEHPGTAPIFDTSNCSSGLYVLEVQTTDGRRGRTKVAVVR